MAFIDRVKYDASSDEWLVYKYPTEDLKLGAQVIVNQSQEAIFVKGGEALDLFGPGTHTLTTGNIPLLNKLINLPFGGQSPFSAEIWYVNKTVKRDIKWGTPSPIQLMDAALGFPISMRSFGNYGIRINDTRSFISQLVGSQIKADTDKVNSYFIGEIIQKLSASLSSVVLGNKLSVLQITSAVNEISESVSEKIRSEFDRFGVELINFNIMSINIPQDEMTKIQDVFAKKMEAVELSKINVGGGFATIKSFETLKAAAENQGNGAIGAMLSAGVGLGAGIPIGHQLGQRLNVGDLTSAEKTSKSPIERMKELKDMLDLGLLSAEEFEIKKREILSTL